MRFLLIILVFLASCFARTTTMTQETFLSIDLGTPIDRVVAKNGEPYSVRNFGGGVLEYEYIERVGRPEELVREYHYYLKVVHGEVVSKRMTTEKQPAYDLIYQEDPNYPTFP